MELQDLIDASKIIEDEEHEAVQQAAENVKKYILSQTVTVQELYDIVKIQQDRFASSSGQVSTWQILDIAKRAILHRKGENNGA